MLARPTKNEHANNGNLSSSNEGSINEPFYAWIFGESVKIGFWVFFFKKI